MVWDSSAKEVINQYSESYFTNGNLKGGYANYFEGMQVNSKTFADRLKRIAKKTKIKGKLLDVGCALGDCLQEAKKLGWQQAEGLDPSEYACKTATKRELRVKKGTLETLNLKANSYDIVLSQDEIEHVTDPLAELERIYKVLKPGGMLFLVTPDIQGWWSKLLGKWWYHYKPGEHVVYFSQETIKKSLRKVGFKDIKTKPTYHIMSLEYILNRLRYYFPSLFSLLLKIANHTSIKNIPFKVYAGELEAWAQKPQSS
jgi:2-polyprenyl-3-methyl-5-hydroxy-6-metoxy-1,4-benzoquinol methylase